MFDGNGRRALRNGLWPLESRATYVTHLDRYLYGVIYSVAYVLIKIKALTMFAFLCLTYGGYCTCLVIVIVVVYARC
jgi:hypothetical protein